MAIGHRVVANDGAVQWLQRAARESKELQRSRDPREEEEEEDGAMERCL